GGEPPEWTGDRRTIEVGPVTLLWNKPFDSFSQWNAMAGQYGRIDHWNHYCLAVEWIEARGCGPAFGRVITGEKVEYACTVYLSLVSSIGVTSLSCSFPTAAARWVVEHGAKIAKERADG